MLRSMGRAPGDVAVDGGAEKVCEPRLPKLPPRPAPASASATAHRDTHPPCHGTNRKQRPNAKGKHKVPPKSPVSFHLDIGIPWRHWKGCRMVSQPPPHAACGPIPLVPAKAGPRIRMKDWIPNT